MEAGLWGEPQIPLSPRAFQTVESTWTLHACRRCTPLLYRLLHTTLFVNLLMRPAVTVSCPMTTVSALIDDYKIK